MKYLSTRISISINQDTWKPFKINNIDFKISHLLFAANVLLFAKVDNHTISYIKLILEEFCKTSKMDINLEKYKLWLSLHIPNDRKAYISNFLQINNIPCLGTYLGYPLKPKYASSNFNYIIHKIQLKLQG